MAGDEWEMTEEQHRQLRHHPVIVAQITKIAHQLCDSANAIARDVRSTEKHRTQNMIEKSQADQFTVVVKNKPETTRPRAYVKPVGNTGLRIEAGHSVLFKAMSALDRQ